MPNDAVKNLASGGNEFAIDLYAQLQRGSKSNLFFSPYSISTALAMADAGAAGETEQQMSKVLHLPATGAARAEAFRGMYQLLNVDAAKSGFELRVANRLWGQEGFHFLPEFLHTAATDFSSPLAQVQFRQSEAARAEINQWIAEQTNDKIQNLIPSGVLDASTRLVLTNAIYFKARWMNEFSKGATADAPFHLSASEKVQAPTMQLTHRLRYAAADDLQILDLPYAQNGSLSMLILLPKKVDGLAGVERSLKVDTLNKWIDKLAIREVALYLPKFKMTSEFSMKETLEAMGMKLAFSDKADFSKMSTEEKLAISAVIHKAFVDVNEEGTEAAAATAVTMRATAIAPSPEPPVEFRADHPFVFLIRDNRTGGILFLGRVVDPRS